MTISELKYLIAVYELNKNWIDARITALSKKMNLSKASVCKAVGRLIESGYLCQNGKAVSLTKIGKEIISDYSIVIEFIASKLQKYCGTTSETAFLEAIGAACALGDESRKRVIVFAKGQIGD